MIESFIKKWLKSLSGFNRALYNVKIKIDKILKKLKNLALKQDNQVNNERQITSQVPQAHEWESLLRNRNVIRVYIEI